jgi:hypothetical protein
VALNQYGADQRPYSGVHVICEGERRAETNGRGGSNGGGGWERKRVGERSHG